MTVESRRGAVAWAMRQRSVSPPRSSNAACRFPALNVASAFMWRPALLEPSGAENWHLNAT
jgi:hypothetical protein